MSGWWDPAVGCLELADCDQAWTIITCSTKGFLVTPVGLLRVTDGAPPVTLAHLLVLSLYFDKYLVTVALFYVYLQLGFLAFCSAWCESVSLS